MKRTSKRYVVTTSALNCYGYRVLTEGVDFSQYEKNPILLWMHQRAYGNSKDQILPLGRGADLQREGDEITCFLEFDETDPFAMQIYNKYENGTLSMVSLGAKPLEWSDEPDMLVSGQTGPTFTKSKMQDISCVDVGGNDDACACQLYDADDKKIEQSALTGEGMIKLFNSLQQTKIEQTDMKLIQLTGAALNGILLALKLDDTASDVIVQKAVADMIQLNLALGTENATLKDAKTKSESDLEAFKTEQRAADVIALVDGNKRKYLAGQRERYITLATDNFDTTKELLDDMPDLQSVAEKLELGANDATELTTLKGQSWDDLHLSGKLERLKELDNEAFLAKRAEKFPVATSKK